MSTKTDFQKELFYKDFVRREDEFLRAPYNPEIEFYSTIKAGDVEKVKELCKESFEDKPGLGRLSENPLQNLKYHFVVTTALVARYCIQGGMSLSEAYGLSDFYIQKADKATKVIDLTRLHPVMCLDYAKKMRRLRKNSICSKPIALCIDYIYDNLHARVTLDELADYVGLNPSYLSRLFKEEVGCPISLYIRRQKLETAKNMLIYSEYKPSEISNILAFPSQSYFTEIFSKYTGLTPSKYRKEHFQDTLTIRDES